MNINDTIRFFSGTENRYKSSSQIDLNDNIKISEESYLALKLSYDFLSIEKLELEMNTMIDLKIMEASVLNRLESFKNSNSYEAQEIYYDLKSQIERSQEGIGEFFGKIWEGIKKIFQKILDILSSIGNWFKNLFSKGEDEEETKKIANNGEKVIKKAEENVKNNVDLKGLKALAGAGAGGATTATIDKTKNNTKKKEEKKDETASEKTVKAAEKNESLSKNIKAFSQTQIVPPQCIKGDFNIVYVTSKIEDMVKKTKKEVFEDLPNLLKKDKAAQVGIKIAEGMKENEYKNLKGEKFINELKESLSLPFMKASSVANSIKTAGDLANAIVYGVVKPSSYKLTPLQIVKSVKYSDIKEILLAKEKFDVGSSRANAVLQALKKDVENVNKSMKHTDYESFKDSKEDFQKIVAFRLQAAKDQTASFIKFVIAYFKNISTVRRVFYNAMVDNYKLSGFDITEDQVF